MTKTDIENEERSLTSPKAIPLSVFPLTTLGDSSQEVSLRRPSMRDIAMCLSTPPTDEAPACLQAGADADPEGQRPPHRPKSNHVAASTVLILASGLGCVRPPGLPLHPWYAKASSKKAVNHI